MLKGVANAALSLRRQKGFIAEALGHRRLPDHGIATFKKHDEVAAELEKNIRRTQAKLLEIWNQRGRESAVILAPSEMPRTDEPVAQTSEDDSAPEVEAMRTELKRLQTENEGLREGTELYEEINVSRDKVLGSIAQKIEAIAIADKELSSGSRDKMNEIVRIINNARKE